ncbi:uncharacterized protein LOC124161096 isoform X4 [Ischnura elegans]|uniref:uncharacterized protein LOC124161096 isoform X4 n=1 Tax=Ischnura elegans TaxID=197161 RepID=UPI001ED88690|nr:uncharacterized protein LOC124161096 isoform X4 [Ischnura elegans]
MERSKTDGAIGYLRTIDERCELMPIPRGDTLAPKPRPIYPRGTKLRGIPPLQLRSKYNGNAPSGLRKISFPHQSQPSHEMRHHGHHCPNVAASHSLTSTIASSRREIKSTTGDTNKGQPFRTTSSTAWTAAKGTSHIPTVERKSSINDPRFRKVITPTSNRWEKRTTADSSTDLNDSVNSTGRNSPTLTIKIPNESYDTNRKYQLPDKEAIPTHSILETEQAQSNVSKNSPRSVNNSHKPVVEEEYSDSSSSLSSAAGRQQQINSVINAEQCVKTTRLKIDYTEKTSNLDKVYTPDVNPPRENIGNKLVKNTNPHNDEKCKSNDTLSTEYSTGEDEETDAQLYNPAKGEAKNYSFGAGDFEEELDVTAPKSHEKGLIHISWSVISAILSTLILTGVVVVATNYFMPIYVDWLTSFYHGEYEQEQPMPPPTNWMPDIVQKILSFVIDLFSHPRRCKFPGWISKKNCQDR